MAIRPGTVPQSLGRRLLRLEPLESRTLLSVIYQADFEESQGYALGPVVGQFGWEQSGAAGAGWVVAAGKAASGTRNLHVTQGPTSGYGVATRVTDVYGFDGHCLISFSICVNSLGSGTSLDTVSVGFEGNTDDGIVFRGGRITFAGYDTFFTGDVDLGPIPYGSYVNFIVDLYSDSAAPSKNTLTITKDGVLTPVYQQRTGLKYVNVIDLSGSVSTGGLPINADFDNLLVQTPSVASHLAITEIKHPTGLTILNERIANFTDDDPAADKSNYTATVKWFDRHEDVLTSTPSAAGYIRANPGGSGFDVIASHTYTTDITKPREEFQVEISAKNGAKDSAKILSKNYAVLFAGGCNKDINYKRFYDSIRDMYNTLKDTYGLDPANIYVVYADGPDGRNDRPDGGGTNSVMDFVKAPNTLLEATPDNLRSLLADIGKNDVTAGDHFLFFSSDHGNGTRGDVPGAATKTDEEILCGWNDTEIADEELAAWLGCVQAGYNTYVFTECFSGGMIDELGLLAPNQFACAAANHYETAHQDRWLPSLKRGMDFRTAFIWALQEKYCITESAYEYAYLFDPYATGGEGPGGTYKSGVDHPFCQGGMFPIFYLPADATSTFGSVRSGLWLQNVVLAIRFMDLLDNAGTTSWPDSNAFDAPSALAGTAIGGIQFRIESVTSGSLTKNGNPVVPEETLFGYGETLAWTPPSGASGLQEAFTVRAWDGQHWSPTAVPVTYNLVTPAAWSGGLLETAGDNPDGILHCGGVPEGQSGSVWTITLKNTGPQPLAITGFSKTGDHPGDFHVRVADNDGTVLLDLPAAGGASTGGTAFTIPVGATYTLNAVCVPQGDGSRFAEITFTTNDPRDQGIPRVFSLDGVGIPWHAPTLNRIGVLQGRSPGQPVEIAYQTLKQASDIADSDPQPLLSFQVDQVLSGTLTMDGRSCPARRNWASAKAWSGRRPRSAPVTAPLSP